MKHVLMIVPFFPPDGGGGVYRPLGFVKYLERYGWRPTVVAPEAGSFWIEDPSLVEDVPPSVVVRRTPTLSGQSLLRRLRGRRRSQVRSSRGFGLLRRVGAALLLPDTYIGWYPFAVREATRLLRLTPFDALYSTSPPETSHLVGGALHRRSRLPWVADFRDPWMNLHLLSPASPLHRRMHRRMEERVCREARVVVTNEWHAEMLRDAYPDARPPKIIRNGFDDDKLGAHEDERPPADRFHVLHAGMLTQKRSAIPFLQGLERFFARQPQARTKLHATFVGPRESANERQVESLGLSDVVEFRDTIPHDQSLSLQRRSHILLLIKHLNPVYRGLIPGKLFEYIGARRPILALVPEGEVADIVRRYGRGEVVGLEDADAIAACIERMFTHWVEGNLDNSYNLEELAAFTRNNQAGELACLLDEAIEEGR